MTVGHCWIQLPNTPWRRNAHGSLVLKALNPVAGTFQSPKNYGKYMRLFSQQQDIPTPNETSEEVISAQLLYKTTRKEMENLCLYGTLVTLCSLYIGHQGQV